jgi:hypothetical protein
MTAVGDRLAALGPDPVDLTRDDPERVVSLCRALAECGSCVLHGSNVRPMLRRLEPRQANDAAKYSGNYFAVYGSLDVPAVLMHAVLDRTYLSSCLDSYTVGYRMHGGQVLFKATDNLYALFKQKDPRLFSGGYVYVLNRTGFVPSPENRAEFFTFQPVEPEVTLAVPASLGAHLFRVDADGRDTVVPYSAGEAARLGAHQRSPTAGAP